MTRTPKLISAGILFCLAIVVLLSANSSPAQAAAHTELAAPRITQAVNEKQLVSLKGSLHPVTNYGLDEGPVSGDLQLNRMQLVLKQSDAQVAALKQLAASQMNPNTPQFHKWLTPEEYGASYGVAQEDVDTLVTWLQSHGLTIDRVTKARNIITFSGTSAQVQSAFHTSIHNYEINGEQHFANATALQIPAALAPVVTGIAALNDFKPRPLHHRIGTAQRDSKTGLWKVTPDNGAAVSPLFNTPIYGTEQPALGPADFAKIYNVQPLWDEGIDGSGQSIAIPGQLTGVYTDDILNFHKIFNLPAQNVLNDSQEGGTYNGEFESEAQLDIQWSGAVARGATIRFVDWYNSETDGQISDSIIAIIDSNLDPIMSVSYDECEADLGVTGNQFYYTMYQQAAVQGISVFVSAGDSGSIACGDYIGTTTVDGVTVNVAKGGLSVNGMASTPYNVAVGGTDFFSTYPNEQVYWNTTNAPTTLESALSYIPETPWNDSCGSTILQTNAALLAALGVSGDATTEAFCNDPKVIASSSDFVDPEGVGGGGPSSCIDGPGQNAVGVASMVDCGSGGYPKPEWQSRVPNIPADSVRDLPDLSLFAGNNTSGFYVYCDAEINGETCSLDNLTAAGGTSFASPAMAGIMALIDQKTNSRQGNPNYILYQLAAKQYSDPTLTAACSSSQVQAGNACMFYDITAGNNAVPCLVGTYNCTANTPGDVIGVLPGWNAGTAYDMASGLGTVNAYNLVNAWSSAAGTFQTSEVSLSLGASTAAYGSAVPFTISVQPGSGASGTPTGNVALMTTTPASNQYYAQGSAVLQAGPFALANGQTPAESLSSVVPGTYQFFATYAGDMSFASGASAATALVITPAATQSSLAANQTAIQYGGSFNLTSTVSTASTGTAPTGTITFTDTTNGKVLGTYPVSCPYCASPTGLTVVLGVSGTALASGSNSVVATYSGDTNYQPSVSAPITITVQAPFSMAVAPTPLTVAASAGPTYNAMVTITPNGAYALVPSQLSFACSSAVTGLACSSSAPAMTATGAISSTLTIQLGPSISSQAESSHLKLAAAAHTSGLGRMALGGGSMLGCAVLLLGRKRRWGVVRLFVAMIALGLVPLYIGCGGSGHGTSTASQPQPTATTTTLTSNSTAPAWGSNVTLSANVISSGSGVSSGTVTFLDGGNTLGSAQLSNGTAAYSTTALTAGQHSITAQYTGDSSDLASTSSAVSMDVALSTTIAVKVSDNAGNSSTVNLPFTVQ